MKTKFILETSTLEDVLMKKYQDMKKQDSKACDVCEQTPCQCNKSDEKELAESQFDISEYGDTPEEIFQNIKNIIDRIALPNTDTEQVLNNVFTKWAGVEKFGDMIRNSDGTINDQAYREAYREASALANFGSQISDQWNIRMLSQNPEAWPRANNIYELSVKWFQLYKQLAKKYKNLQPQVAEGRKTNFRFAAEQQSLNLIEKIKNSNLSDVVKLYLIAINDPTMPVFKASYRSFPKGNEVKNQVKKSIAQKYNVDVKELEDAEEQLMVAILQGKKSKGLEEATPGKSQENHDAKLTSMAEDQDDECPVHGYYALPNQEDESGCTCDSENRVEEGSFDPQHYFDANKDSKVRRDTEVDQSQHKQDWGRDPLDDITHLAFKAGEKVKGMFKKPSELNELGANNPPQGTSPAPTANTAANVAATTSSLNPQEKLQLDNLLKKAGVVK
jgi:hypothetical protein